MKTITIKEPWATLIAKGYKEYEFRTWKTNYRGEILIHAGKGVDKAAIKRFEHLGLNYMSGFIIARANITDCVYISDEKRTELLNKDGLVYMGIDDNSWNGYGFKLENVVEIEPIKTNGKLSLWEYKLE